MTLVCRTRHSPVTTPQIWQNPRGLTRPSSTHGKSNIANHAPRLQNCTRATCLALRAVRALAEIELFPVDALTGINNLIWIVSKIVIVIVIAYHVNCVLRDQPKQNNWKLLLKIFKTPRASASRNPKCDGRTGTAFCCTRLEKITKAHVKLCCRASP
jgi:hypothetical protein